MEIRVKRLEFKEDYTAGKMYIDGEYFCDTIEDKYRDLSKEKKVYAETAIPYGTYDVQVVYAAKFKKNLPWIKKVPHFEGIMIHGGNTAKDSAGCIIIGESKFTPGKILNSSKYVPVLTEKIKAETSVVKIIIEK